MKRNISPTAVIPSLKKINPNQRYSDEDILNFQVTEFSLFKDDFWNFRLLLPGVSEGDTIAFNWNMQLFDGSRLGDLQHQTRKHWAKTLLLSLLILPSKGRKLKPLSLKVMQAEFKWIISWMSETGLQQPTELTQTIIDQYLTQLPQYMRSHRRPEEINSSAAVVPIMLLLRLWQQRTALAMLGINSLAKHPFAGRSIADVAAKLATEENNSIPALPDEISIPLLNTAAWFLSAPLDQALLLSDIIQEHASQETITNAKKNAKNAVDLSPKSKIRLVKRLLKTVEIDHAIKAEPFWERSVSQLNSKERIATHWTPELAKNLWDMTIYAAIILVQGCSGMRSSELLGIEPGIDEVTKFPLGVRVEQCSSGLHEWFVIRTNLYKDEDLPREVDWVLGMRPVGSKIVPLAVKALQALNWLYAPWRRRLGSNQLILNLREKRSLFVPLGEEIAIAMMNGPLNDLMKKFIGFCINWDSLPNESLHKTEDNDLLPWRSSQGQNFRTHMLRKTWAQFTLVCDSRLLPAIQMQFHHVNLSTTEKSYIGRDPETVSALNSAGIQKVYLTVFENVIGINKLSGRMGKQIDEAASDLRTKISDLSTSKKWQEVVEWTDRHQLRMYFTTHATCCPIRANEMRCHEAAQTPPILRTSPNVAMREPGLCAGCACAIIDKSHELFWSQRYIDFEISKRQAELSGLRPYQFREITFRAEQAKNILIGLGSDLIEIGKKVLLMSEAIYGKK